MGKLDGQVALITGSGSGIGKVGALRCAREGAKVVVVDISGAENETVAAIKAAGGDATAVHADVSQSTDVQVMFRATRDSYGRLDVLWNNAGIGGGGGKLAETTEEAFDRTFMVNLRGVFLGMKYGIPLLIESGGGAIVNTASMAGLRGSPGNSAYAAAKGGVVQLTKTAALEYAAENIRVNAICPGGVDTPMMRNHSDDARKRRREALHPLGRLADPEEVASVAVFLASSDASFVTGLAVPVDGGRSAFS